MKILAKAMIKQIDRVKSDLANQIQNFKHRAGSARPICVGIVGINYADEMTSFEGDRSYPTDGKKYKHPIQEAEQAKLRLGLGRQSKVMLFFGRIRPYKGLEYALRAFEEIAAEDPEYYLVIAGESKKGCEEYFAEIQRMIDRSSFKDRILARTEFIPDENTEIYLKAADVLVLPYIEIFQSGVLFLAYSFGLPVIAADVGSFREEIVEGKTGFVCKPCDVDELANVLREYFRSDLFRSLAVRRPEIKSYAFEEHSWKAVAEATGMAYESLLKEQPR